MLRFYRVCEILTMLNKIVWSRVGLGGAPEPRGWKALSVTDLERNRNEVVL